MLIPVLQSVVNVTFYVLAAWAVLSFGLAAIFALADWLVGLSFMPWNRWSRRHQPRGRP
jgi:hypothetical protein